MLGVIEATAKDDQEKNSLCPPVRYWDNNEDYLTAFLANLVGDRLRAAHPALGRWIKTSRLNLLSGMGPHRDDPRVIEARERIKRFGAAAATNLPKLLSKR
jgi:hypothetical protein